jgi:hypothetical protein
MEPPTTDQESIGHDESPVHDWRVSQLKRLGVPGPLAEIDAARCWPSRTTNGPSPAAIWAWKSSPRAGKPPSPIWGRI